MSTSSPQATAAGEQSQWQAQLAQMLAGVSQPELAKVMGPGGLQGLLSGTDASGKMAPDAANMEAATTQLNEGYDQAKTGSREAISYNALRSGESRRSPGAESSGIASAATSLDRDRSSAMRNLEFQSAQSSMSDYNKVLSMMGQGVNTSLGLAGGFSGASGAAIGGLSNTSQFGSVLGGASAGAGLGMSVGGGYGAAIGAVAGGVYGGLSNP
jgi:hypothetical protein